MSHNIIKSHNSVRRTDSILQNIPHIQTEWWHTWLFHKHSEVNQRTFSTLSTN
jgi:hypothetical protein